MLRASAVIFAVVPLLFIATPFPVSANSCVPTEIEASGYLFASFELVEYSVDGFPIFHFRIKEKYADGRAFSLLWIFQNDECARAQARTSSMSVSLPAGVTDWSVRFTSLTHFDVWDDQNEVLLLSRDVALMPLYAHVQFQGGVAGGGSRFSSSFVHIQEGIDPPVFENTISVPDICDSGNSAGYYFDSYERAEYVEGFLRVHLRLKSPYNDGRPFTSRMFVADENCENFTPTSPLPSNNTVLPAYVRYYSLRFTSPTHWELWNDEAEQKVECTGCSGDIPGQSPFVLFDAGIDGAASNLQTTPFPPVETPSCAEDCFSSVVFIPGIKGSVLKSGSSTLWPPTIWSDDIPRLALDSTGESINEIYVDGILNTFYLKPIYEPFGDFLDDLVTEGTINNWYPLAYDWRFSPEKLLEEGIKTSGEIIDIIDEIELLADDSQTGQVVIVAHSMGGLMGKAIIKQLEDEGKEDIIDSFIMVGVPQLGTPQAVGSILHGDDEGIGLGFIVNPAEARTLAQNMPGAYNLLPSPRYFDDVADPVITFDSETEFTQEWRDFWGDFLGTYTDFLSFAIGDGVARAEPPEALLRVPEVLSEAFMDNAADFHNTYDNYEFPEDIRIVQVAGWGRPTTKAVEYTEVHGEPSYRTVSTMEGDKTVVYPSALSTTGDNDNYFFNIFDYNELFSTNIQHSSMLNVNPITSIVEQVVKEQDIQETDFILGSKPHVSDLSSQLIVTTRSPVLLGAYDEFGNFTGIDPNQDLSAEILSITEDIPGSTFFYTSESQHIFLPKDGTYEFVYTGIDEGPTTVEIEDFIADNATFVTGFSDIPTTANTKATFMVDSNIPEETVVELDYDGDGETDEEIVPDGTALSLEELIAQLKNAIEGLDAKKNVKKRLLRGVERLERRIEFERWKNEKVIDILIAQVTWGEKLRMIDDEDAEELFEILETLEEQVKDGAIDQETIALFKDAVEEMDMWRHIKRGILKRVKQLEERRPLLKYVKSLERRIEKEENRGRISEGSAQELFDIIEKVENAI